MFMLLENFFFSISENKNNPRVGFPRSSVSKLSACNAGDPSSIPGLGRSPGEGYGNPSIPEFLIKTQKIFNKILAKLIQQYV